MELGWNGGWECWSLWSLGQVDAGVPCGYLWSVQPSSYVEVWLELPQVYDDFNGSCYS